MRHATVVAILAILDMEAGEWDRHLRDWLHLGDEAAAGVWAVACDWTLPGSKDPFWVADAWALLGMKPTTLPTCPHCAALVDLALLIRAEAEQAKYDAEREAEKRGAA